ncbi:hypothetical protein B0H21DRAFT_408991 [Amylocystis lapponica]|nr:hypothetical protein B0H21DRAFT_408991 [Amylocystis lapponica]
MDTALLEFTRHMSPAALYIPWRRFWEACLGLIRVVVRLVRFVVVGVAGVVLATFWLLLSIFTALVPHRDSSSAIPSSLCADIETHPSPERPSPINRKSDHPPSTLPTPTSSSSTLVQPPAGSHVRFAKEPERSRIHRSPSYERIDKSLSPDDLKAVFATEVDGRRAAVSVPTAPKSPVIPPSVLPRKPLPRGNSAPPVLSPTLPPDQTVGFSGEGLDPLASPSDERTRCRSRPKVPKLIAAAHERCILPERRSKSSLRKQYTLPTPKLVQRTDPYQAPYFFPSPASPEAATYVAEVRTSRIPTRMPPIALVTESQTESGHASPAEGASSSSPARQEAIARPEGLPEGVASQSRPKTIRRRSWHLPLPRPPTLSLGADTRRPMSAGSGTDTTEASVRSRFRLKPLKSRTMDSGPTLSPVLSASHDRVPSEFGELSTPPPPVRRMSWRERFHHRRASSLDAPAKFHGFKKVE